MASTEPVHPLRIAKSSAPAKMQTGIPRPLSELSPTAQRRNSPSWRQNSPSKMSSGGDSSPFQTSPPSELSSPRMFWQNRNSNENALYGGRSSGSPSPNRRPSVERLQKASRVKNSNIYALEQKHEYDPARVPPTERPLSKIHGNVYRPGGGDADSPVAARSPPPEMRRLGGHGRSQSELLLPSHRTGSPTIEEEDEEEDDEDEEGEGMVRPTAARTQARDGSPIKSSLSTSRFRGYDPETQTWSNPDMAGPEDGGGPRQGPRLAKSVTFDAAPPQVNEYEMATPDISSIGSNSREGSYESMDDEEEEDEDDSVLYNPADPDGADDSFDASLEDLSKTPVVGPDDWRHDRVDHRHHDHGHDHGYHNHEHDLGHDHDRGQNQEHDEYVASSTSETATSSHAVLGRPGHHRTNSTTSNGDHRPLPPLPGEALRANSTSPMSLNGIVERTGSPRNLPSPPAAGASPQSDPAQNSSVGGASGGGSSKITLEERLRLMLNSDDSKSAAEIQRERRMRRGNHGHTKFNSPTPEPESGPHSPAPEARPQTQTQTQPQLATEREQERDRHQPEPAMIDEGDDTLGDMSVAEYQLPPKISRESIMRRVDNKNLEHANSDYRFSSPALESPERKLPLPAAAPAAPPVPAAFSSLAALAALDPDVPIPSTEDSVVEDSTIGDGEVSELSTIEGDEDNIEPDENVSDNEGSVIVRRDAAVHHEYDEDDEDDDITETDLESFSDEDMEEDQELAVADPVKDDTEVEGSSAVEEGQEDVVAEDEGAEREGPPNEEDDDDDDNGSHYSDSSKLDFKDSEDEITTPRIASPAFQQSLVESVADISLASSSGEADNVGRFAKDFAAYMLPEPPEAPEEPQKKLDMIGGPILQPPAHVAHLPHISLSKPEYDGSGWGPDEEDEVDDDLDDEEDGREHDDEEYTDPGTPDSVIHHPVPDPELEELRESPAIPEQIATIKSSSGSKLKTRPSATPSDMASMREARRQVSREVPPIPERHKNRLSRELEQDGSRDDFLERHPSFKNRSLTLDLDLGLSLDQDFERVIEAQKRGYLMRQNTKVITASDKEDDYLWKSRSAGNSPLKKDRPQSWTVEPWNPRPRRSVRSRPGGAIGGGGPVPPLPGRDSNAAPVTAAAGASATAAAAALNPVSEDDMPAEPAPEESGERGRLFVKVMGVKDLDLPLPKNERTWFSLTLDNGVHCVTTAWLELARNAPIGQEFELVVPNDLEFQLTLSVKLEKPAASATAILPASPTKPAKPKTSTFSRVFASPKKRKEMEARAREEEERLAQQQRDAIARQKKVSPTGWDLLSPLAADDGSFARAYVCLKDHESRCFGRPYSAEVACFNEWATEEAVFASSVKSKRGNTSAVVRRAPYKIGKLELQLLFVPRPRGATDDDMPKSMNSCIREIKAAEERLSRTWEGHLSQQGGDCPYWRRRYFKLAGTKLTAYHEATRQPRATINLSNAKRLIDDRQTLTEKETTGKGGRRRRSAFAEEEDGYMFVEEGFRIRFNNGESIDFYADTAEDKERWMHVLSDVIGRDASQMADEADSLGPKSRSKWCELVLKREETIRRRADAGGSGSANGSASRRVHSRTKSMYI